MYFLSAFLVGFLGSFHCAGMCGPIALALPVQDMRMPGVLAARLLYNAGRIFTYAVMGLLAGLIGHTLSFSGLQSALSMGSGVLILVVALFSYAHTQPGMLQQKLTRVTGFMKKRFRVLFGRRSLLSMFLVGTLNGLLPCGFVYLALAAAIAAGTVQGSAAYMLLFGLGTLPMLLAISLAGHLFGNRFAGFFRRATPFVAAAVALLLISRGLSVESGADCCHR